MAAQQTEDDETACKSYLIKNIQTKRGNLVDWADLANKMLPPTFNPDGIAVPKCEELTFNGVTYAKDSILLYTLER